jgi:cytochrome c-type biogenesis protein CcmH
MWRALAASLPADDPRRAALTGEIARVEAGPSAAAQAVAAAAPEDQAQMIRGMVDGLAARLAAQPDDPEGWARLVRAYGVLGDADAQARALAGARKQFADRPAVLAEIEAAARK